MAEAPQDAPACPLCRMLALRRMLSMGVLVVVSIILLAVLARLVAAPLMERARAAAHSTRSLSNLKQICLGIQKYYSAHGNQEPADLEALVENGFLPEANVLVDPADKTPVLGRNGCRLSYEYPGALPSSVTDTPPDFIIVYSRKGVHPDARIVLHVDGVVSSFSEGELHKDGGGRGHSLKHQYDWLMEHHGTDFTDAQRAAFRKFYEVDAPSAGAAAPVAAAVKAQVGP